MQNLIKNIQKQITLSEKDIHFIENIFNEIHLQKGEYILYPNNICENLAFINKGLLRHFVNNDGVEETIYFSAENEFVCDFDSFLSKMPTKKGIIALEATTLFSISHQNLQQFYDAINYGDRFGRLLIETAFTKSVNHIISIHTDSAEQRYQNFISIFKHIAQRIPQYYIASFIGVTPQSLSRIRKNMLL